MNDDEGGSRWGNSARNETEPNPDTEAAKREAEREFLEARNAYFRQRGRDIRG